jgi:hypothetical protein
MIILSSRSQLRLARGLVRIDALHGSSYFLSNEAKATVDHGDVPRHVLAPKDTKYSLAHVLRIGNPAQRSHPRNLLRHSTNVERVSEQRYAQ